MDEYPHRVLVRGEWWPNRSRKLQIYFQSKKKSGGSDCVVEFDDESYTAVIGFKQEEVLERVLRCTIHEITIDNKQIKVFIERESKVTDVVVNTVAESMDLSQGAVSRALLQAAGPRLQSAANDQVRGGRVKPGEMVVTDGFGLRCRKVFHTVCPPWDHRGGTSEKVLQKMVKDCLQEVDQQTLTSVTFPAIGTGNLRFPKDLVSRIMLEETETFCRKAHFQHLKEVVIIVHPSDQESVDCFKRAFREERQKENKGLFSFAGTEDMRYHDEEFVMVGEEFTPAIFQLCGQTSQDVSKAKDFITSLILREQLSMEVKDPAISCFTPEDAAELQKLQREMTVSIRLDKTGSEPVIHLEGLTRDVVVVDRKIVEMILRVARKERTRQEAYIISTVVEWQYLDRSNQVVPFNMYDNMTLEQAFQQKQRTVIIKIGKHSYAVNLGSRIASRPGGSDIELKRVEQKDQSSMNLPSHWDDMKGKIVVQIPLHTTSSEYSEVEKEFRKTGLASTIIQIDRVQNSSLWKNYMIKKDELDQKNNHTNNEKRLFHGTKADAIDKINNHGFNRSYAGSQVGAKLGNGTYFGVDPQYSARGYCAADARGHKRMYWARVLVGDYTQGVGGMIVPPAKTTGNAADTYDSVTDNSRNPTMFVVFHDVQAYPEYIITFT